MKKVSFWLIVALVTLVVALAFAAWQGNKYYEKWEVAMGNLKACDLDLSMEKNKSTAYKLTIDQLEYFQDSVMQELDKTRKELKVKDSKLQSLQYVHSTYSKTDTITLNDTIFREPSLALDTLIGDKWYNVKVGLKYPSTIAVTPEFNSEKHIVVSLKKETVNPPKKFFLLRWFQKKHKVLNVDVVEKNPYITEQTSKYIEVLK